MTSLIQFCRGAIIALAIMAGAFGRTAAQDLSADDAFSPVWLHNSGVTTQDRGGPDASHGFTRMDQKDSLLAAQLSAADSTNGLADFFVEFYLRLPNPTQHPFSLKLATDENAGTALAAPALSLVYDPSQGWGTSSTADGQVQWSSASAGLISPNDWYHIVFTGRDWGRATARYSLQIYGPATTDSATAPVKPVFYQITNSAPSTGLGRYFSLSDTGGADVAEVRAGAIQAYQGPVARGVDTQTLTGKVMCGYQGWFGAPDDGSGENGWHHWVKHYGPFADGNAKVDLWPDVSELSPAERFVTGFKLPDGRPAEVFSSYKEPTVLRHFQWMRDYGIDGAFVQRFVTGLHRPLELARVNTVLANCRAGANQNGRAYAVMYDLSGLGAGDMDRVINDWRALRREMAITDDPAYLHHHGKPVVAVWGIGFDDHRQYTLAECRRLLEFLKNDPESGGCTVIVGVPAHWRELDMDAVNDPELLNVLQLADVISPWTVGRYHNPDGAARYAETILKPDEAWCRERNLEYLPVIFPGFSWHNMYGDASNKIPRLHGKFLWSQFLAAKKAGATMIYVAMFDEVDEGTAIFKCVNDVPVAGKSQFVDFEGLPSDFYLKMVGSGAKLLRGEIPLDALRETPAAPEQN